MNMIQEKEKFVNRKTREACAEKENMEYINDRFCLMKKGNKDISVFDIRKAHFYIPEGRERGIFMEDAIHYTPETNRWAAQCILAHYKK